MAPKKVRRKRTVETPIAAKIRAYAQGYEADGREDWANGMRQAADLVDGLLRRENDLGGLGLDGLGPPGPLDPLGPLDAFGGIHAPETQEWRRSLEAVERRVRALEALVTKPAPSSDWTGPSPSNGKALAEKRNSLASGCVLSRGEERILAALSQHGARTSDELCALVDYRATSIYTYLSNLRAVGYILTEAGHHATTAAGDEHAAHHDPIPIGPALYQTWLERLPQGEKTILTCIAQAGAGGMRAADLAGDATGLKGTSVYTYVSLLVRRKLIVRLAQRRLALAPILVEGSSS